MGSYTMHPGEQAIDATKETTSFKAQEPHNHRDYAFNFRKLQGRGRGSINGVSHAIAQIMTSLTTIGLHHSIVLQPDIKQQWCSSK